MRLAALGRAEVTMGVTRRVVLGTLALAGGGLAIGIWNGVRARRQRLATDPATLEPSAWLQLSPDGSVTLQVDRAELGQGVMTGFVTLVAEELDLPPDRIRCVLAPVHPLFQDPAQLTGESTSMRKRWEPLRQAGATARAALLAAAARAWRLAPAQLTTDGAGQVLAPDGRSLPYASLASAAAALPLPADVPLRAAADFRYIGHAVPRPDVPAKVQGRAVFGLDVRQPGQRVAVIRRPPRLRASVLRLDDRRARELAGVVDVFPVPTGVAVVATDTWAAREAAAALAVDWTPGPLADFRSADVVAAQRVALDTVAGHRARDDGDVAALRVDGPGGVSAEYALPYLAHATLEPMNATLWFRDGGCEAWIPSQAPDLARQTICDLAGLPRDRVTVHSTFCGGGFGRRATMDYVAEAVAIARRVDGPVQLVWTREDDLAHGLYREASLHRLRAVLGADGGLLGWEHRLTGAGLNHLILPMSLPLLTPEWLPAGTGPAAASWLGPRIDQWLGSYTSRQGSADQPYAVPNCRVEVVEWNPGVPVTIWRSVGHSANAFAVECFVDELARAAGVDALEFRRRHLPDDPRRQAVLTQLAAAAGWGHPPPGRFQGLALHAAFGSVVGQVAEVSVADGRIRVHRVCVVVDCGTAINPDVVRQQLEGGVIFGLSAALHGRIDITDGAVENTNFHRYPLLTLADAPAIDVHILPSTAPPGGIGESGVPAIAPAVANAVFAATGQRLRSLPLLLDAPDPASV